MNEILEKIHSSCIKYIPKKTERKKSRIPHDRKVLMRKQANYKKKIEELSNENCKNSILEEKIIELEKTLKLS